MYKTRLKLMLDYPFFGTLALSLPLVRDDRVGTAATDGKHIFFNQSFIDQLSDKMKLFLYLHELGHVLLMHMLRRGDRNKDGWNAACDYAVNLLLDGIEGLVMPPSGLLDYRFIDMPAEEIYSILYKEKTPEELQACIRQASDFGKVLDAPEDLKEHETEITISNAVMVNEMAGIAAGNLEGTPVHRLIEKMRTKKASWRAILEKFLTERCQSDYNWMKPNFRYMRASNGIILPSLDSRNETKLGVAFDTSGSIDTRKASIFFSEFKNIIEEINFKELHVVSCTTKIHNPQTFQKGEEIKYSPMGTGGTAAAPVWQYFKEKGIDLNCLVYFTDLKIGNLGKKPGYPVLWVVDKQDKQTDYYKSRTPFGEFIIME
jgi:predicted metal-dependent peptidase